MLIRLWEKIYFWFETWSVQGEQTLHVQWKKFVFVVPRRFILWHVHNKRNFTGKRKCSYIEAAGVHTVSFWYSVHTAFADVFTDDAWDFWVNFYWFQGRLKITKYLPILPFTIYNINFLVHWWCQVLEKKLIGDVSNNQFEFRWCWLLLFSYFSFQIRW